MDEPVRMGIKEFSELPTIPQLHLNGGSVGGSDIMLEMYQKGECAPLRANSEPRQRALGRRAYCTAAGEL